MKLITAEQMRGLDRRTIEEHGTPGAVLMERAAAGVVEETVSLLRNAGLTFPFVLCVAGKGNNGGDAFAAARLLRERGVGVAVWLAGRAGDAKGDAALQLKRLQEAGIPFRELPDEAAWKQAEADPCAADVIVDAVLGTGVTGAPHGVAAAAIRYIRHAAEKAFVLSVDLPSGLNADTGVAEGVAVQADVTLTFGLPKVGMVDPRAAEYVGAVKVADIGLPPGYVDEIGGNEQVELIEAGDVREVLPRRERVSHKGRYGRVLLVGGSAGYSGAMSLAAAAALRSGAGLVHVLVPRNLAPVVGAAVPGAMVRGGAETGDGVLSSDVWPDLRRSLEQFDAILIGPGLTRSSDGLVLVKQLLRDARCSLVLDADAISVLQGQPDAISHSASPVVITPHPGEFATLFDQDVADVQADRFGMATAAAKLTGAVVVLKGAGTVIAQRDARLAVNLTGNPGMATGGTGDVLAGLLTSLLGQGLEPRTAACAAVYLHGRAGDLAALRRTQYCLQAEDLVEYLPAAFRELHPR